MKHLESCIQDLFDRRTVGSIAVRVGHGDRVDCEIKRSSDGRVLTEHTMFDMASVTKIVATTPLALIAIDRGILSPSDRVSRFFPVPSEKQALTVQNLLTHTIGIGHKSLLGGGPYETVQDYILSIPSDIPIGSNVLYSCPGFILLGRILEKLFDSNLSDAFANYVARPLGMKETGFLPERNTDTVNANLEPSELGTVNDYNCRHLGGVCGNAGLFSNLADMTRYVKMLLSHGAPIISAGTFDIATENYTPSADESRGLGFLYVDGRTAQTGGLFPPGSIGHCGHTGQSVFVDIKSGLYVIILSDATVSTVRKYGEENYGEVMQMRHDIHAAVKADLHQST